MQRIQYSAKLCTIYLSLQARASLYGSWLARTGKIGESSGGSPRSNASVVRVLDASLAVTLRLAHSSNRTCQHF